MNLLKSIFLYFISLLFFTSCSQPTTTNEQTDYKIPEIRGWNILSDNKAKAIETIDRAEAYDINHLQLSHHIIMDLKDVRDTARRDLTNELIAYAHQKGIEEVTVWDHCLYNMDYYPDEFKVEKDGQTKINLDDPAFWQWFKNDYREMLKELPDLDGLILTFIETGAHVEDQYSEILNTEEEKLAALVDSLSTVVIDEFDLSLYLRTFMYTKQELNSILKCLELIKHEEIITMMKETPHDFFLTHPVNENIAKINRPIIIEFDATHEFNGQNVIASIYPETHMKRYRYYAQFDHMVGYVNRMDRYGDTHIVNTPGEINAYAIHRTSMDTTVSSVEVFEDFLIDFYGQEAMPQLKEAFKMAYDINMSIFYTLGTNTANHSDLAFDYISNYTRHVPGRWLDSPVITIDHGINKEFHIWKDVINHISPPKYKTDDGRLARESPEVIAKGWLEPKELMNQEYLDYIMTEKEYGVNLADSAYQIVRSSQSMINDAIAYQKLHDRFERNLISANLRKAAAGIYYGKRLWDRGPEFQTDDLKQFIEESIEDGQEAIQAIRYYDKHVPTGGFEWRSGADRLQNEIDQLEW